MSKIFYFLMASIAFTGLQVGTAAAAGDEKAPAKHHMKSDGADQGFTNAQGHKEEVQGGQLEKHGDAPVGTKMGFAPAPQDHKVGQERWDPMMGGKGTPTMDQDHKKGMRATNQSPR